MAPIQACSHAEAGDHAVLIIPSVPLPWPAHHILSPDVWSLAALLRPGGSKASEVRRRAESQRTLMTWRQCSSHQLHLPPVPPLPRSALPTDCPPPSQPALQPGCVAAFLGYLRRRKRRENAASLFQCATGRERFQEETKFSSCSQELQMKFVYPQAPLTQGVASLPLRKLSPKEAISDNTLFDSQSELCFPIPWVFLPTVE